MSNLFDSIYSPIDTIKNEADKIKGNINIYLPGNEKNTPEKNRELFLNKVKTMKKCDNISFPHIFGNINYQNEKCINPTRTYLNGIQPPEKSLLNCETLKNLRKNNSTFKNTCSNAPTGTGGKNSKSKSCKSKKSCKTKKSKTLKRKRKSNFKYETTFRQI
jgi:hypothetical protein